MDFTRMLREGHEEAQKLPRHKQSDSSDSKIIISSSCYESFYSFQEQLAYNKKSYPIILVGKQSLGGI
jgi:hypothetical protein